MPTSIAERLESHPKPDEFAALGPATKTSTRHSGKPDPPEKTEVAGGVGGKARHEYMES